MSPKYISKSNIKSLWQEYSIFDDHVEFSTLMGSVNIPFDQIEKVSVSESELKGLFKGDLHLKGFRPALKLDWANFLEHVVLDKSSGTIHRILFTPTDPHGFAKALEEAIKEFRSK